MRQEALTRWTPENAAELYGIRNWGAGYYDVAANGEVVVRPGGVRGGVEISLMSLVKRLEKRGLNMPVVIRFANILASQIAQINESFRKAIREAGYSGKYRGVFPIKVNQQSEIVEDITEFGAQYHHGLEAGSKAELIAAVSHMHDPEALIVCNGYKDEEYLDLALHAQNMGVQTLIVIEMPDELDLILERAAKLHLKPRLGVRAKLSSRAGGHWDASGGDRSKFGLDASQIIELVDSLRQKQMLDCLQLLHYHLGSQVSDIRKVRNALQEACRFYVDLYREGAPLGMLNIGGGLAVDYDGSHSNFSSSTNYSIAEYASDVVEVIKKNLDQAGIPHPMIVSESGRATAAHHSVFIFNVLDVRRFEPKTIPDRLSVDSSEMLENLLEVCQTLTPRNVQEAYHDAVYYREEIRGLFLHGDVTLRERALGESIFWRIIRRITELVKDRKYIPDEMESMDAAIADVYYGNFSVFQSVPDFWAVDQLFPVMPIHRLNERPTRRGVIADITCDSDGKIDRFIDLHDVRHVLELHELKSKEEYYVGVFLTGAYQETIGDMHNLIGNTNALHVWIGPDGKITESKEICGDRIDEILTYMEYSPEDVLKRIEAQAEKAVQAKKINVREKQALMKAYRVGISGYTYFEK
jgi:arginine decarboxylase